MRLCQVESPLQARKGVDSLIWHGSNFWVCVLFCKVRQGDNVTSQIIIIIGTPGMEAKYSIHWRGCQIPASLPYSKLVDVRKDIQSPKTCSNIPRDRQLLMVTKRDFLEMEASLWLNKKSQNGSVAKGWLVYLMQLGSSCPYLWLTLEENGR